MKKILLALICAGLVVGRASAADRYWDADLTAAGNDATSGAGLGGSGTWDTTTTAWWDGTAASDIAWADANTAIFTGSGSSVVIPVATTRSAVGLTFKSSGYDLTATGTTSSGATARGIITLTATAPIIVDSGITAKISAKLSGTTGFALSGGGTLQLAESSSGVGGLNNITGNFSVTGSTLEVNGGGQLGGSTGTMTLNNATYRDMDATVGGNFTTSTARNIILAGSGATFDTPSAAGILIYAGTITGAGTTLTKMGPAELRMSSTGAAANFTFQKLKVLEGRYTLGQAATLGSDTQLGAVPGGFLADAVTLDGQGTGAILRFNGGSSATTITTAATRGFTLGNTGGASNTFQVNESNATIPAEITGLGGFTKTGALILNLNGANTYQGGTTITAGTIKLGNTTGSGVGTGAVTVNGGNLQVNTTTGSQANGGVTVNAGGTLSGTGTLDGALSISSGGKVTPGIGGGNAVLTVPTADFSSGNILESTLGSAGTSDKLTVATASTGLNLNGGTITLQPITGTNPAGQTFTLINYTGGFTGSANSMFLNNITGYDAQLDTTLAGAIRVTVGSTLIDRTWIRETDFGTWNNDAPPGPNESANWAKPDNTTPATAANGVGSTMRVPAVSPIAPNNPINSQTITLGDYTKTLGTLVLDNPNQITFTSAQSAIRLRFETYSGNALIDVKQGDHTLNTGATATSGGTVQLIVPTDIKVANGASLTMGPTANIGGMNKLGTGTLKIIGADWNQTGATNVKEGTLQYSSDNAAGLGNSSVVTIDAGATVDMNSNATGVKVNDTIGALAGAGSFINHGNLTIGGVNAAGTPVTFSGKLGISADLGGNGNPFTGTNPGRIFTKNGAGTQIISATLESTSGALGGNFDATTANTASGAVLSTVAAGTLLLNNPSGTSLMTSTAPLSVSSGATLGGSGYNNGPVTLAAGGNLSPGANGANSVGAFHLGLGTLTLSGNTTTTVSALKIDLSTTIANGDIADLVDASGATVTVNTNTNKAKVDINNAGTMTGGTYEILRYGTSTTMANLVLGTVPTNFIAKLFDDTVNKKLFVLTEFIGDFNNDNVVDSGDYAIWRKNNGIMTGAVYGQGDANNDGAVNTADFDVWRSKYGNSITPAGSGSLANGAVPEPSTLVLALAGLFFVGAGRRRG